MGLRLFADGEREHRPPPALVDACLCRPGAGEGAFAIIVLFAPRLSCCGVGRAGSVRGLLCIC